MKEFLIKALLRTAWQIASGDYLYNDFPDFYDFADFILSDGYPIQLKKAYLKKAGISIKSNKISEIIKIRKIIVQIIAEGDQVHHLSPE